MTAAEAEAAGFKALTTPFAPNEGKLLAGVIRDIKRGRIPYLLVEVGPGQTEVWRQGGVERPDQTLSLVKIKGERK